MERKYLKPSFWNSQVSYIGVGIGFSLARIVSGESSYVVMLILLIIVYILRYLNVDEHY